MHLEREQWHTICSLILRRKGAPVSDVVQRCTEGAVGIRTVVGVGRQIQEPMAFLLGS